VASDDGQSLLLACLKVEVHPMEQALTPTLFRELCEQPTQTALPELFPDDFDQSLNELGCVCAGEAGLFTVELIASQLHVGLLMCLE